MEQHKDLGIGSNVDFQHLRWIKGKCYINKTTELNNKNITHIIIREIQNFHLTSDQVTKYIYILHNQYLTIIYQQTHCLYEIKHIICIELIQILKYIIQS
jgi:hypothetical protein